MTQNDWPDEVALLRFTCDVQWATEQLNGRLQRGQPTEQDVLSQLTPWLVQLGSTRQQLGASEIQVRQSANQLGHQRALFTELHQQTGLAARRLALFDRMIQTATAEEQVNLRRRRAQSAVNLRQLQQRLQAQLQVSDAARAELNQALAAQNKLLEQLKALQQQCTPLQRQLVPIAVYFEQVMLTWGAAHCQLGQTSDVLAWRKVMTDGIGKLIKILQRLEQGVYATEAVQAIAPRQQVLLAEGLLWATLLSDQSSSAALVAMVGPTYATILHQPYEVFGGIACVQLLQWSGGGSTQASLPPDLTQWLEYHRHTPQHLGSFCRCVLALWQGQWAKMTAELWPLLRWHWRHRLEATYPAQGLVDGIGLALLQVAQRRGYGLPAGLPPTLPLGLLQPGGL